MTIRNLERLLEPRSVAVVGADTDPGRLALANIVAGGFAGPVWPVAPAGGTLLGLPACPRVADLPDAPDVAVVAVPAAEVAGAVAELAARGCRLAVVATGGLDPAAQQAALDAARPHLMRIVGPDSLGLIVPGARLAATVAPATAAPGHLALVSQSGALATALLDWAAEHGLGLSTVVSLGAMADVDVADCLDLLAGDAKTRAILVYLEAIPDARKFLSAARAAARLKPVIALKPGRAAAADTGALVTPGAVVDAALARAGILRVGGLAELFAAAETVARFRPMRRARLAIVTNSNGAGALAVDRLAEGPGALAELAPATRAHLAAALPPGCARPTLVDIERDATPERYLAAIEALAADPGVDVILAMNCPTASAAPGAAAEALAGRVERGQIGGKALLACWMGGASAREARAVLRAQGVASYDTPGDAAAAIGHLTDWGRAQAALLHVPDRLTEAAAATPDDARERLAALVAGAAAEGRSTLTAPEAHAALAAYGVPAAEPQPAATRRDGHYLVLGIGRDAVFGPVIVFGAGGLPPELLRDTAIELPPLDSGLAAALVARTRVGRLLAHGGADLAAVNAALIALSHMIEDFPCLRSVEVDPLLADPEGVLAHEVRVAFDPADLARRPPNPDLAIRPYPAEWRRTLERDGGRFELRPIRPGDAPLYRDFLAHTSPEDLRRRFLAAHARFPDELALRLTQLDYDREIAFVALTPDGALAGVSRLACAPDHRSAEYALIVRSDQQGRGLGSALMRLLIDYARADGLERLEGMVLADNREMLGLIRRLGFEVSPDPEPGVVMSRLEL
jgi:acetyltransferase